MLDRVSAIEANVRCVIVLAAGVLLSAPAPCAGEPAQPSEWYARAYRMEHGLPSSVIQAITQDHDGFLWLGTRSGVVRFDGLRFVRWNPRGEPQLPSNGALALLTSRDGSVWIGWGSITGGVSRLLDGSVVNYTSSDGLPRGAKSVLLEDRDGTVWVGGASGLAAFDGARWRIVRVAQGEEAAANVHALHEDRQGRLWVATSAGIFRRPGRYGPFERVSRAFVLDLSEDAAGALWVTDPDRAFSLLDEGAAAGPADDALLRPSSGEVLFHDRHGIMWVGTRRGLLRVANQGSTASPSWRVDVEEGVAEEGVATIYEDRDGDVWVGTRGGLVRIFKHYVTMFTQEQGLRNDVVGPVERDDDGNLWVATLGALHKISAGALRSYSLPGVRTEALHLDLAARLWLATDDGVARFENGRLVPLALPDDAPRGRIFVLASDLHGGLWMCGDSTARWDGERLSVFNDNPAIGSRICAAAYRDAAGKIWLGFGDGSLLVYENAQFNPVSTWRPDSRHGMRAILGDREGRIWVAGRNSLSRIEKDDVTTVGRQNGFPGNDIGDVVDDRAGHLWISVDDGIIRLHKSEFDKVAADAAHQIQYLVYGSADGVLEAPTRNGYPAAVRGPDGRLWFQTVKGLAVIDPSRDGNMRNITAVEVDRIIADGQPLVLSPRPLLPPRTATIQLDYTAASLAGASKVRFAYMLEGFDENWIEAGTRRQAFYNSLPPGAYRFHVRTSIGGIDQRSAAQEFSVLPAFYQRAWFAAVCLVLVGAAVVAIHRRRVRIVAERSAAVLAERARIGREIHDTMLQSMAGIALEIHAVAKQLRTAPGAQELTRIRRKVQQHMCDARDSILELRSAEGQTDQLAAALRSYAEVARVQDVTQYEVTAVGTAQPLPANVQQELLKTAREAIQNALSHAEARRVQVTVTYGPHTVRVAVSDDGLGFDPAAPMDGTAHWGIIGMQERTAKIQGKLRIESRPGHGTDVEIVVPVNKRRGLLDRLWRSYQLRTFRDSTKA